MAVSRYTITENDVLYYLHIPKTAGTSFTDIIIRNFPAHSLFQPIRPYDFTHASAEAAESARFVAGHWFYDLAPIIKRKIVYVTMLRDPVERTISQYAQIKRGTMKFANVQRVKSQSLLEFVKDPDNLYMYANAQTRQLGTSVPTADMVVGLDDLKMEFFQRVLDFPRTRAEDNALLEPALERLESFAFVGLTERFDESLEVLCDTFGWALPAKSETLNISGNRPTDIPQEAIDIIHEHTRLDAKLYEAGKRIFENRYQQFLAEHPSRTPEPLIDIDTTSQKLKRIPLLQAHIDRLEAENARLVNVVTLHEAERRNFVNQLDGLTNQFNLVAQKLSEMEAKAALDAENNIEPPPKMSSESRFSSQLAALRRKIIPEGSVIEKTYLKIRNRLA